MKTTVGHVADHHGLIPASFFLLSRGTESHIKLFDHVSTEIANNIMFSKRPFIDLHFRINIDDATRSNAKNIGDLIYRMLCKKLKVNENNPIYVNKYNFRYNLAEFSITVCLFLFYLVLHYYFIYYCLLH